MLEAKKRFDEGDGLLAKNSQMAALSFAQAIGSAHMALNLAKTGVPHANLVDFARNNPVNPFKHDAISSRKTAFEYIENALREIRNLGFTVQDVL